jgi:hypothetical protein
MEAMRMHEDLKCDICGSIASRYCEICSAQYCKKCSSIPDEGGFDCIDKQCQGFGLAYRDRGILISH